MVDIISSRPVRGSSLRPAHNDFIHAGLSTRGIWTFSAAAPASYLKQAAPVDGDVLTDTAANGYGYGDGVMSISAGQSLRHEGGGFGFDDVTAGHVSANSPAGIMAEIYGKQGSGATATAIMTGSSVTGFTISAAGSGYVQGRACAVVYGTNSSTGTRGQTIDATVVNGQITALNFAQLVGTWTGTPSVQILPSRQNFLFIAYIKFPTLWNADEVNSAGLLPMLETGLANSNDGVFGLYQKGDGKLRAQLKTANNSQIAAEITPEAGHLGQIMQIGAWRDQTGFSLMTRPFVSGGQKTVVTKSLFEASATNVNFSTQPIRCGVAGQYAGTGWLPARRQGAEFRFYRLVAEALDVTGRDAETVLDADFDEMLQLAQFS